MANEVSIRGVWGVDVACGVKISKLVAAEGVQIELFWGGHVPLRKEVTVGFDSP